MEVIQNEYEEKVASSKTLTYDTIVTPFVKKMLEFLEDKKINDWPKMSKLIRGIDIYSEAIMTLYVSEYIKGNILPLTNNVFVTMLIKHPYLYNVVMQNKTMKDIKKFKSELLRELESSFNNMKATSEYELLHNLLNSKEIKPTTALDYYHYLLGFRYELSTMSRSFNELPKGDDISYHIVHLSYGLTDTRSIVIYKPVPRSRENLLYVENTNKSSAFNYPKVYNSKSLYTITDHNLKKISNYKDKTYVILCYDDAPEINKCTFTVAYLNEKGYLNKSEIEIFADGGYFPTITEQDLTSYINLNFAIETRIRKSQSEELRKMHNNIIHIISEAVRSLPSIIGVINTITRHPLIKEVINPKEIPFLKIYLQGLHKLEGITNVSVYQSYILGYFYKDESGTSLLT